MHDARWTIIIPVKRLAAGKSRLRDAPGGRRPGAGRRARHDRRRARLGRGRPGARRDQRRDRRRRGARHRCRDRSPTRRTPVSTPAIALGSAHAGTAGPQAALLADLPALRSGGTHRRAAQSRRYGHPGVRSRPRRHRNDTADRAARRGPGPAVRSRIGRRPRCLRSRARSTATGRACGWTWTPRPISRRRPGSASAHTPRARSTPPHAPADRSP